MRRKVISLFIILITINFSVQGQSFVNLSEMEVSLGQQTNLTYNLFRYEQVMRLNILTTK